jgi:plasmid stability protein
MSSLTLKDMPNELLNRLRARARRNRRSLGHEAIVLLEQALNANAASASAAATERDAQLAAWQRLAGRWPGGDVALDSIISDIYEARTEGREVEL